MLESEGPEDGRTDGSLWSARVPLLTCSAVLAENTVEQVNPGTDNPATPGEVICYLVFRHGRAYTRSGRRRSRASHRSHPSLLDLAAAHLQNGRRTDLDSLLLTNCSSTHLQCLTIRMTPAIS